MLLPYFMFSVMFLQFPFTLLNCGTAPLTIFMAPVLEESYLETVASLL
jgi:hypothetical protein